MRPQKIYIIILTAILSLLVLTGCKETPAEVTLSEVTLSPNLEIVSNTPTTYRPEQSAFEIVSAFIKDFNTYPPISHEVQNDITLSYVYSDLTNGTFYLDLDLIGKHIYVSNETETRIAHDELSQRFFASIDFAYLFEVPVTLPIMTISLDQDIIEFECSSDLTYASYNGTELAYSSQTCSEDNTSELMTYDLLEASEVTFDIDISPDTMIQQIKNLSDDSFLTYDVEDFIYLPEDEGSYEITVTCSWDEENEALFYGDINYTFNLKRDIEPVVSLSKETLTPGEILVVRGDYLNDNQTMVVSSDISDTETTYTVDHTGYGLIAVPCWYTPNNYEFTVDIYEDDTLMDQQIIGFEVVDKDFPVDHLYVTESTASIRTDEHAASDQIHFDRARANPTPYPLFDGAFIQPAEYKRISTEYGVIRVTNDDWENTRRHYGIDFANDLGTPVKASNSGIVTLSYQLYITGNTIIIDHGMGLFSMYYHLDELLVEEGQTVNKGDHIANMGSTGYSTGSHLHFGIWHDGVYLNPWSFFENGYLGLE